MIPQPDSAAQEYGRIIRSTWRLPTRVADALPGVWVAVLVLQSRTFDALSSAFGEPSKIRGVGWVIQVPESGLLFVGRFGTGASAATFVVSELAACCRSIVLLGTAGSLAVEVAPIGSVWLVDEAFPGDGVAALFSDSGWSATQASADLCRELEAWFGCDSARPARARSLTVPMPCVESAELADFARSQGCLLIEMEAASLFAVASMTGVAASALVVVSDLVDGSRRGPVVGVTDAQLALCRRLAAGYGSDGRGLPARSGSKAAGL